MRTPIVYARKPVTLLGAGEVDFADLRTIQELAPVVVAADGAASVALKAGFLPEAVIGDLDSLDDATVEQLPPGRLHRISEQDSTDFGKCLQAVEAPLFLAVGFQGKRLDHSLAVLSELAAAPEAKCIVIGSEDIVFRCPQKLCLPLAPGTRISLFPMEPVRGRSLGLHWPIDGLVLEPAGRIGTSNRATGPVEIEAEGALLVILPRSELLLAIAALVPELSSSGR